MSRPPSTIVGSATRTSSNGEVEVSISVGDFTIGLDAVVRTLIGQGERVDEFVIMDLRMPRALVGLIVGAALGISGALTQSIARNPLASPDVLGITGGASATAVFLVTASGGAAITSSIGLPDPRLNVSNPGFA